MSDQAWYDGIDIADVAAGGDRIRTASTATPRPWAEEAIERGLVDSRDAYRRHLREAALAAFQGELAALAGAADRELVHLIRTFEATREIENELRQRIGEAVTEVSPHEVESMEPAVLLDALPVDDGPLIDRLSDLLSTTMTLREDLDALDRTVVQHAHAVAPNLSQLAGPHLAAQLIAAAGSLDSLAKMPSSTVQVLGAESALFAHLRGEASSPKHGLIYTHPAVHSAPADQRGKIARTLAGKLTIAARIDRYRGELEPTLEADLEKRLRTIRTGGR